jgi:type IV pilus assembly protein PilN
MFAINLLPWRKLQRKKEKKKLLLTYLAVLFTLGSIILLKNYYANSLLDKQSQRNQCLRDEISQLNIQLQEIKQLQEQRDALIAQIKFVNQLQVARLLIVHLFDELVKLVPEGTYLDKIEKTGDQITLQGFSESNRAVTLLIQSIEQNQWMQNPVLGEIKKEQEGKNNKFTLTFILKSKQIPKHHEQAKTKT